jgi:ribosomal protein L32
MVPRNRRSYMRRRTRLIASAVTVALVALAAFALTAGAQNGIR